MTDQLWEDEFQVENAIKCGLYHLVFNDEFKKLDSYFESLAAKGQITGKTKDALQNVGGHGFMTPYYFIVLTSKEEAYDLHISNPDESLENLRNAYDEKIFKAESFKLIFNYLWQISWQNQVKKYLSKSQKN